MTNHFHITYNLYSALRELRSSNHDRTLWVDAMCINQGDNAEKNTQVRLMRNIYAKAAKVVVRLGEGRKRTSAALELVRDFETIGHESEEMWWADLVGSSNGRNIRKTYRSLLEHEW